MSDRDAVTLDKARAIARAVTHQHGGTAQALVALDKEITRQDRELGELRADVRRALVEIGFDYPTDMIPDPAPGQHGKSVDSCSARGIRFALERATLALERVFARRAAPADACRDCLSLMPNLLISELRRRSWHSDPTKDGVAAHWGKQEEVTKANCLTRYTTMAVCGARFSYDVDSGD